MANGSFADRLHAIDAALRSNDADAARRLLAGLQLEAAPMTALQLRALQGRIEIWQAHAQQLRRATATRLRESIQRRRSAAAYSQESHHTVC